MKKYLVVTLSSRDAQVHSGLCPKCLRKMNLADGSIIEKCNCGKLYEDIENEESFYVDVDGGIVLGVYDAETSLDAIEMAAQNNGRYWIAPRELEAYRLL